jgi:hypothetical protein
MADGDARDKANSLATRGILFFDVPSQGMDISSLRAMVRGQANDFFLQALRPGSDTLRNQLREFRSKFPHKSCRIVSFYETELSPTAKQVCLFLLPPPPRGGFVTQRRISAVNSC